jgi:hypothetical protein
MKRLLNTSVIAVALTAFLSLSTLSEAQNASGLQNLVGKASPTSFPVDPIFPDGNPGLVPTIVPLVTLVLLAAFFLNTPTPDGGPKLTSEQAISQLP